MFNIFHRTFQVLADSLTCVLQLLRDSVWLLHFASYVLNTFELHIFDALRIAVGKSRFGALYLFLHQFVASLLQLAFLLSLKLVYLLLDKLDFEIVFRTAKVST